jgi:hypothetical protein
MEIHTYKLVSIEEISSSFPYGCRYRFSDALLRKSIEKNGLLEPILLERNLNIVSGHKRFVACRELGMKSLPARILQREASKDDLFFLALASNINHVWSDLDRATTLKRAQSDLSWPESRIVEDVLPILGLPAELHFLTEYSAIGNLHAEVLHAISDEKLPFRGISSLKRFSCEDQEKFVRLISDFASLTTNQLLKVSEWLFDLMKVSKFSLETYLQTASFDFMRDPQLDRRVKGEKFFQAIRAQRFPRLVEQEQKFQTLSQELRKETQEILLEAPSFFEDEGITVRAKLRDRESLDRLIMLMERQRKLLNSLFEVVL